MNKTYTEQLQAMASNGSNMRFHTMILWIFDPGDVFFFFFGGGRRQEQFWSDIEMALPNMFFF